MVFSEAALEACSHFQISHSQECICSHTYSVMYTYLYMCACIHVCAYLQTKINTQPRVNLLSISLSIDPAFHYLTVFIQEEPIEFVSLQSVLP